MKKILFLIVILFVGLNCFAQFPASPSDNDEFTYNGLVYKYNLASITWLNTGKLRSDTINCDSIIFAKSIYSNTDTLSIKNHVSIDSNLYVTGNILVNGNIMSEFVGVNDYVDIDSIIVTSISEVDTWYYRGNDATSNRLSVIMSGDDFTFNADTLQYIGNHRDSTCFILSLGGMASQIANSGSINIAAFIKRPTDSEYSIIPQSRIGSFNKTSGEYYALSSSSCGIYLVTNTKIQIRIKSDKTGNVSMSVFSACLRR